jgi:predicted choloylglycine hydrolase
LAKKGKSMTLLKELKEKIKEATKRYEEAEEASEVFAEIACEAWEDLSDVYEQEDRELNRIDIEGE